MVWWVWGFGCGVLGLWSVGLGLWVRSAGIGALGVGGEGWGFGSGVLEVGGWVCGVGFRLRWVMCEGRGVERYSSRFKNNGFAVMRNCSKGGSYLRLIDLLYHSTLGQE